jgi:hypothetical protein
MLKTPRHITYYALTEKPVNKGEHYTAAQVELICNKQYSDRQLATMLGRTIHGIEAVRKNLTERTVRATSAAFISEEQANAEMEAGESC